VIDSIGSTLAGLSVHAQKVRTVAHNVANVNTEEFKKDCVTIHSNAFGQPEANTSRVNTPGYTIPGPEGEVEMSNVDIVEEMVDMTLGKNGFLANLKVLKREEERFDSVLDILA
jgi:flagellar basal body rod protein FlgC